MARRKKAPTERPYARFTRRKRDTVERMINRGKGTRHRRQAREPSIRSPQHACPVTAAA